MPIWFTIQTIFSFTNWTFKIFFILIKSKSILTIGCWALCDCIRVLFNKIFHWKFIYLPKILPIFNLLKQNFCIIIKNISITITSWTLKGYFSFIYLHFKIIYKASIMKNVITTLHGGQNFFIWIHITHTNFTIR